jgi:hypothetical protein
MGASVTGLGTAAIGWSPAVQARALAKVIAKSAAERREKSFISKLLKNTG